MPDNNEHHERLAHLAAGLTAAFALRGSQECRL